MRDAATVCAPKPRGRPPRACPTVVVKQVPAWALQSGTYRRDEEGELEKRCGRCRQYWPADNASFYASRNEFDGLHRWCKGCFAIHRARYRRVA